MIAATPNGTPPCDVSSAARFFFERGYMPVPVSARTKKPTIEDWSNMRLTAADLDEHFPAGIQINLGLCLGTPSHGAIDVDLDCDEAVTAAPFLLPPTPMIHGRPSKPKSHYWYRVDSPPEKASLEFHDLTGEMLCERRSTGGQTVVPPSVHPEGETLIWHSFGDPAKLGVDELTGAVKAVAAAALIARHWPAKGSRHKTAMAITGGLLRAGWSQDSAETFLRAVCAAAKTGAVSTKLKTIDSTERKVSEGEEVTGWPTLAELIGEKGQTVVQRVKDWLGCNSSFKKPSAVRPPVPYVPFPVQSLPEPIASFVAQGAQALGCDAAYLALPALSTLAALIGNSRSIRLKRDWYEPSVVWSAIVGDSGTLKSPAQRLVVDPIFRLQRGRIQEHKEAMQLYEVDAAQYQKAFKKDPVNVGPAPERPACTRYICSDVTVERLAGILADNLRGVLVFRDELGGWLASFNQYKSRGGSDLASWLQMFRAEPLLVDRKTGERPLIDVPRAAVSVSGGIQPGCLAQVLMAEYMEAGLAARVLFAMPPKIRKKWTEDEIDPLVKEAYEKVLEGLMSLESDKDDQDEIAPFGVKLSPEAKQVWVAWYNRWAARQASVEGHLAAAFSKLEGYAARFALIHHTVSCVARKTDSCDPVEPVSVEAGIALAEWFAREAERIYHLLGESEDERLARKLVEFVRSLGGEVTSRRLQRANTSRYKSSDDAEAALQTLADAGLGEWLDRPRKGPGRPPRTFRLFPDPTPTETDKNTDNDLDDGPDGDRPHHDEGPTKYPTPPSASAANHEKTGDSANASVSVSVGLQDHEKSRGNETAPRRDGDPMASISSSEKLCQSPQNASHTLIASQGDMQTVIQALDESPFVGVDTETTGLDSRTDRLRLLSLATDRGVYVIDCFHVDPSALWSVLAEKTLVIHNAAFDLSFLAALGFTPGQVRDTMLMSQVLYAGASDHRHTLQACVERELGQLLSKEHQDSNWSRTLTREQFDYAAVDAQIPVRLHQVLDTKIHASNLAAVVEIEHRCLPAIVLLARSGVAFNNETWQALAKEAQEEADRLAKELDAIAPAPSQSGMFTSGWNWNSPEQVKQALGAAGYKVEATDDDTLAKIDSPLAVLLRQYRDARKRCTTYGRDWLQHVADDGRVYANWRQIGAASGRMSCSKPNLQQLPRGQYRRCFEAPPGRVLVKADYSQIELRIAAKVSGDSNMLAAYKAGEDLHILTAQRVLGVTEVTKHQRQLAKALNFGLLYGMGVKGFQSYAKTNYGVVLTEAEAQSYRNAFFSAYPGLRAWHWRVKRAHAMETRTLAGRRRRLKPEDYDTVRLNTPIQGTGADGFKLALALLWERRDEAPGAFPVLVIHDEIVVECDQAQIDAVAAWLKAAMVEAMFPLIDPVPVEVEIKAAKTWGGD